MKKLLASAIICAIVGTTPMVVGAPETDTNVKYEAMEKTGYTAMLNDIAVPYEVLMYAQLKYQGYAVTKLEKARRNTQQVYKLRVDRDDQGSDGFYLVFDKDWKLLGEEKIVVPVKKPAKVEKQPEKKPLDTSQQNQQQDNTQKPDKPTHVND